MDHETTWSQIEKMTLNRWAMYQCEFERVGDFITINNELIILYATSVTVFNAIPQYHYKVVHIKSDATNIFELDVPIFINFIDVLSNGHYIIAKSDLAINEEANAYIYSANNNRKKAFRLGDGISQLQVDEKDQIWVGYSKSGISGRYGWSKENTIGKSGLNVFNKNGIAILKADGFKMEECLAINIGNNKRLISSNSLHPFICMEDETEFEELSIQVEQLKQWAISQDKKYIIIQNEKRILKYTLQKGQYNIEKKIEFIHANGDILNGKVLFRNNFAWCINGHVIYRQELF